MTMNLPPLPEIPLTPEHRLAWIWWGRECFKLGMECSAVIWSIDPKRKESARRQRATTMPPGGQLRPGHVPTKSAKRRKN